MKSLNTEDNEISVKRSAILQEIAEDQAETGNVDSGYLVIPVENVLVEDSDDEEEEDYNVLSHTDDISPVELAVMNSYLYRTFLSKKNDGPIYVRNYGHVDSGGKITFGGGFDNANGYWFWTTFADDPDNEYVIQTKVYVDNRGELYMVLHVTSKNSQPFSKLSGIFTKLKKIAFNNSEFKGKCIKVKVHEQRFRGIEIINLAEGKNPLILSNFQKKYLQGFVNRVRRGSSVRYLLNGEPGTGKTESIRDIARQLMPDVTFIIPDFANTDDLTTIMEACEIFEKGVIIMDDIDLYLGSRENGSYTRLLGQFLSFFDGVKKRKISLLSSTNDKNLVDKAAERPGRFNITLDYGFLDEDQIVEVCKIHLSEKWLIDEVFEALTGNIDGKKVKITGAFIANLAENIKEMSEDEEDWGVEDTVSLITESYKGFYSSQVEKEKTKLGFNTKQ